MLQKLHLSYFIKAPYSLSVFIHKLATSSVGVVPNDEAIGPAFFIKHIPIVNINCPLILTM
jgi:hypothetical protein